MIKKMMGIDKIQSYWASTIDPQPPVRKLEGAIQADIAIVGAGLLGISAAYQLKKLFPSKRIVVIEARRVSNGASGRNAGHIMPVTARASFEAVAGLGLKKGALPQSYRTLYDKIHIGYELFQEIVDTYNIKCAYTRNGSLSLAHTMHDARMMERFATAASKIGIPIDYIDRNNYKKYIDIKGYYGAVFLHDGADINPARYVTGLADIVRRNDVDIYEDSPITEIKEGEVCTLTSLNGQVTAETIVLAANAYLPQINYFKKRMITILHPGGATEPISQDVFDDIGWSSDLSFNDSSVGVWWAGKSEDNRIVMGGGNVDYMFNGLPNNSEKYIQRHKKYFDQQLVKWFPKFKGCHFEFLWSGSIDVSLNLEPAVGVMGKHKNIYYGCGFSGEGVNLAHLSGKIIADLYAGNEEPWQDVPFVNQMPLYIPPEPFRYISLNSALSFHRLLRKFHIFGQ